MNSCLNPILYAFLSDNFRKGFLHVLRITINAFTLGQCCVINHPNDRYDFATLNGTIKRNRKLLIRPVLQDSNCQKVCITFFVDLYYNFGPMQVKKS